MTGVQTSLTVDAGDPDGDSLITSWSISGPAGSNPSYDATATSPTVTFDQAGDYTVSVTVDDGSGGSDSDSRTLSVQQTATSIDLSP